MKRLFAACLLLCGGCYHAKPGPMDVFKNHHADIRAERYQAAYRVVATDDQKAKSLEEFVGERERAAKEYAKLLEKAPEIKKILLEDDRALVTVLAPSIDTSAVIREVLARSGDDPETVLREGIESGRIPVVEKTAKVQMVREADGWRIRKGWAILKEIMSLADQKDRLREAGKKEEAQALDAKIRMLVKRLPNSLSEPERRKMEAELGKTLGLDKGEQ